MQRAQRRCDGRLANAKRLPNGSYRIPATLTRVGVLTYRRADGTIQRELRPPEEVFAVGSLETLQGAPLTDLHPQEMVDPANHQRLAVGHVADNVRSDAGHVAADVVVTAAEAIRAVGDGSRTEISCGYECDIDPTPGEYQGEAYDVIQRAIRYNHAALLPAGRGRAGATVGLRLDANGHEIAHDLQVDERDEGLVRDADPSPPLEPEGDGLRPHGQGEVEGSGAEPTARADEEPPAPEAVDATSLEQDAGESAGPAGLHIDGELAECSDPKGKNGMKIRIDGVEYDTETEAEALGQAVARLQARADTAEQALTEEQGRVTALEADVQTLQGELTEANAESRLDARAAERAELIETALRITGKKKAEVKFDGLSSAEVRRKVYEMVHGADEAGALNETEIDAGFAYLAKFHRADAAEDTSSEGTTLTQANAPGNAMQLREVVPRWAEPLQGGE